MEPNAENLRDRLISRLPQPSNLADYRREVAELLAKNEKGLRREKWGAGALWMFLVITGTLMIWLPGQAQNPRPDQAAWLAGLATFMLIGGAVELLKHFINRARVELLKEAKQTQLQVLELKAWITGPRP